MKIRRCCLCNGKVINGICIECGMHNKKQESDYRLNQGSCDREPMMHVHKERSISSWDAAGSQRSRNQKKKSASPVKRLGIIWLVLMAVMALAAFIPVIANLENELSFEMLSEYAQEYEVPTEEEYDPYAYLEKTLAETGITYSTTLTAGHYIVGIDIPEGQYTAHVLENCGELFVEDYDSGIFLSEYLASDDIYNSTYAYDIRLFNGAELTVSGNIAVEMTTENALTVQLPEQIQNPLTEVFTLEQGLYTAGEDFPEGTYDFVVQEGYGSVNLMYIEDGVEYVMEYYCMNEERNQLYDPAQILHVVIPEGFCLDVRDYSDFTVKLVPSERIIGKDYAAYYNGFY